MGVGRRVGAIALVHDALSMSVDEEVNLDEVVDRIPIMNDVARVDSPIRINQEATWGVLDADRAMALVASGHRAGSERHRACFPARPTKAGG